MTDPSRTWTDGLPLEWTPPPVRRWLWTAAALGVAGDWVFRAEAGAGLALWLVAVLAAGGVLARGSGPLERGRVVVLGLGAVAAATLLVRAAPPLRVLAIGLVLLSAGWSLLARPWASGLTARVAALVAAGLSALGLAPVGALAGARDPGTGPRGWSRRSAVAARGFVVAIPVLLVVGALFVAGDPVFAGYADRLLRSGLETALSHLALALLLAWLAGGLVYAIATVRVADLAPPAGRVRGFAAEAVVALLFVDLLFAVFLAVQARALFGGRAFVEATAGMTYAEYARSGFFQLALVAMIALPVVLLADWVVARESSHRRAFVAAACGLAAGIVLVLASAAHRMALYVGAYGLTEARLYASALMAWLAVAALWLAGAIAAGRTERFAPGALVAGWAVFLALVALNPSGLIVRVNAARAVAGETPGFDVAYGVNALGLDAVPALADAVGRLPAAESCRVAASLLEGRAERAGYGWRGWTLARWRADQALAARGPALRAAAAGCREG